jgi:hypothetical protein
MNETVIKPNGGKGNNHEFVAENKHHSYSRETK